MITVCYVNHLLSVRLVLITIFSMTHFNVIIVGGKLPDVILVSRQLIVFAVIRAILLQKMFLINVNSVQILWMIVSSVMLIIYVQIVLLHMFCLIHFNVYHVKRYYLLVWNVRIVLIVRSVALQGY